jgi:PHD/YefM family antitoxin component YafN of YafNO toxin-antitoxin module
MELSGKHKAAWVTISTDEYESMKSTIDVLSDPGMVEQLRKSEDDIKEGRTKNWNKFIKELKP